MTVWSKQVLSSSHSRLCRLCIHHQCAQPFSSLLQTLITGQWALHILWINIDCSEICSRT